MSDINTTATVNLSVNGVQAQQVLQQLKQRAMELENAIAKAAASGNKIELRKLRRELADTKRQIREIESSTQQVEAVMRRLDKATPKELNKTLQTLNRQLDYMERGSAAWNSHVAKIQAVKAELSKVNAELRNQESFWQRFNRTVNDWQTTLMGAAAAMTGLVMAGKAAVQVYAEIDAEMASVRKFTGMTAEEVEHLNEQFKKIDTRTSREDLNKLAQEAGRLGLSSEKDVLGFVKAANQINVALDDLGEGATLTLSKLTDIFGDKQRLGVEQSLLAVGSVINELSQNCTAAAPYLANFAKRMAGVGAQARMTIPEIMGFAAVLDSQGQAAEMSATAVSKLIMDMFKQQDKVIKATGINAKKFKEALTRSTNEGLLMLLERLKELGNIDVLAPVFKDMGENGARAAQVISALAGNLDTLKWQQKEAAKAFEEATSVTKEYEVQNTTVQAQLDKARKGFTEMAATLGQKLMPVLRYFISSTSAMMRGMSIAIDFIIKYKGALITLAATWAAYTVAANASNIALKIHYGWLVLVEKAQAIGKVATLACSAAYNRLTGNITRADAAQKMLNTTMKMNPWGLAAAAIAAVIVGLVAFAKRTKEATKAEKEMADMDRELAKAREDHMQKLDAEKGKIERLVAIAKDETVSKQKRKEAIDALNAQIPNYCASLDAETGKYRENKQALDDYLLSLEKKIRLEANREEYERLIREDEKLKREIHDQEQAEKESFDRKTKGSRQQREALAYAYGYSTNPQGELTQLPGIAYDKKAKRKLIKQRIDKLMEYSKEEDLVIIDEAETEGPSSGVPTPTTTTDKKTGTAKTKSEDKFKAEKEWKEQQEAINRIAYATGEKNYESYTTRMLEIATEYEKKRLEHTDLTTTERLTIEAQHLEAQRKQTEQANKFTIEEEQESYRDIKALMQQRYIDGKITMEQYNANMELIDMQHLQTIEKIYEKQAQVPIKAWEEAKRQAEEQGETFDMPKPMVDEKAWQEYLKAHDTYLAALVKDQQKRQKEYETQQKKHQAELQKLKDEFFGNNAAENLVQYNEASANLDAVYQAELKAAGDNAKEKLRIEEAYEKAKLALKKKYNQLGTDDDRNALQKMNDDLADWLNGDCGQTLTKSVDALTQGMASIFSQVSSLVQSEMELETAAIEKRYEREISMAEGNKFKTKRLEQQKQKEVAQVKNEANRKLFAMQVIQAVAQTATAALNAYSSAAAIPVVGYIIAPIAAAMAVAAGAMQVAAIKKQQQASQAQGYSEGGFTRKGRADEVAGVVHAGEWVASQKLVASPVARPLIEALDYAQRTNTIGSLRGDDVSRSITAPMALAQSQPQVIVQESKDLKDIIARLNERLDEPFVTVNTVTGDKGIKQAQDEYQRLMNNKSPKSKRK